MLCVLCFSLAQALVVGRSAALVVNVRCVILMVRLQLLSVRCKFLIDCSLKCKFNWLVFLLNLTESVLMLARLSEIAEARR